MSESADNPEVFWVDPESRGVFPLDNYHISRSLRKAIRKADFTVKLNRDFAGCVQACADRSETWINETLFDLYQQLHQFGHAHSLEVYRGNKMIGGVFGVTLRGAFFGESMFSRQTNGSKIALAFLTTHLKSQGYTLFDTQFLTEHLASLGAIEIPRSIYHEQLSAALQVEAEFGVSISAPDI